MLPHNRDGVQYLEFEGLSGRPDLVCAVTTRLGGESAGCCRWLNLSYRVEDAAIVRANRDRVGRTLGFAPDQMVVGQQVHGTRVARVAEAERGRGAFSWESGLPETDALITDQPGLVLAVLVADCAPVVLYDPVRGAVGVAHAGWRGAVGRIAADTVKAMAHAFGCRPADLRVGIGPSIGPCCYEVGEAVVDPVRDAFSYWADLLLAGPDGRPHFDLPACIRRQLAEAGVLEGRIETSGLCTACHTDVFYSHRAEQGQTGRFAALIGRLS